jgi:hypothetical protein
MFVFKRHTPVHLEEVDIIDNQGEEDAAHVSQPDETVRVRNIFDLLQSPWEPI